MMKHLRGTTYLAAAFWAIAFLAIAILAPRQRFPPGWDVRVYTNAIHSLRLGHDPYADGIAVQQAFHARILGQAKVPVIPCVSPPCTYVYSPITLPPLRAAAQFPRRTVVSAYILLLALGILASSLAMLYAAEPGTERNVFALILPAVIFFPGLVLDFSIISGNVVYIFYGLVFSTAALGWKRHQWLPFYLAIILTSCYKPPLLTLLAIPVLSEPRVWRGMLIAAACALTLFAAQPLVWPNLFHHYLQAVELQFSYNKDFGVSPAGFLGSVLTYFHHSYSPWTTLLYFAYAACTVYLLWDLRSRYLAEEFSLRQWIPVMLLGVLLLNPRIKEYDVAAATVPMALVVWRLFARNKSCARTVLESVLFLAAIALAANTKVIGIGVTYGILIAGLFAVGTWHLRHPGRISAGSPAPSGQRCGFLDPIIPPRSTSR